MTPKLDGPFQMWVLTEQEQTITLASPLLLAYLQNKRAEYASIFVSNFATAGTGELPELKTLVDIERNRAMIQVLDELINECIQAADAVHQEQQLQNSNNPEASHY